MVASPQKRLFARLIILGILGLIAWFFWHKQQQAREFHPVYTPQTQQQQGTQTPGQSTQAPSYAIEVLQYIRRNGEAPEGFVGGREFMNKEKKLPQRDASNQKIRYSEWDVHPKVKGQNRGPERLVTGSDHSAYFSADHYKTFIRID